MALHVPLAICTEDRQFYGICFQKRLIMQSCLTLEGFCLAKLALFCSDI